MRIWGDWFKKIPSCRGVTGQRSGLDRGQKLGITDASWALRCQFPRIGQFLNVRDHW